MLSDERLLELICAPIPIPADAVEGLRELRALRGAQVHVLQLPMEQFMHLSRLEETWRVLQERTGAKFILMPDTYELGTWTATAPTEPGWYWYRDEEVQGCTVVSLAKDGLFRGVCFAMAHDAAYMLAREGGEFYSIPVKEPQV